MSLNHRVPSPRGPNAARSDNERIESTDKSRWACGRNVKMAGFNHTYTIVKLWRCKTRENGKVVEVTQTLNREEARAWVDGGTC